MTRMDAPEVIENLTILLSGSLHPRFIAEDCLDYLEVAADHADMGAFVAVNEMGICGLIIGQISFWPWNWEDKYISTTVFCGRRCGKELLAALKAWAISRNIPKVLVGSSCDNPRADALLNKSGNLAIKTWSI